MLLGSALTDFYKVNVSTKYSGQALAISIALNDQANKYLLIHCFLSSQFIPTYQTWSCLLGRRLLNSWWLITAPRSRATTSATDFTTGQISPSDTSKYKERWILTISVCPLIRRMLLERIELTFCIYFIFIFWNIKDSFRFSVMRSSRGFK